MIEHIDKVGQKFITNEGYSIEIIDYIDYKNCSILFDDGTVLHNRNYLEIKKGQVRNKNRKSICGIGFHGFGKYVGQKDGKEVVGYSIWRGMFKRCYSDTHKASKKAYKDVTVCEEWHNFQNFAKWFEENYNPETMKGWQIDKDIICPECKVYSPETCAFVPIELNNMFIKPQENKRGLPVGVTNPNKGSKYYAYFSDIYIGKYDSIIEAKNAYESFKLAKIKELTNKYISSLDNRISEIILSK